MVSIWFFIGISLAVNGGLILAAGIYQLVNSSGESGRRLVQLACQRVVGRSPAGLRPHLLLSLQAGTPALRRHERGAI